jgi:hypothetical protein
VIEAEVYMLGVDGNVVALFEPSSEGVADGDGVEGVIDGFGGTGFGGEEIGADVER